MTEEVQVSLNRKSWDRVLQAVDEAADEAAHWSGVTKKLDDAKDAEELDLIHAELAYQLREEDQ